MSCDASVSHLGGSVFSRCLPQRTIAPVDSYTAIIGIGRNGISNLLALFILCLAFTVRPAFGGISIQHQPLNTCASPGDNVQLSVAATTTLTHLYYQWQFNGTNIAEATGPALDLLAVDFNASGFYQVRLWDDSSNIVSSDLVQLKVVDVVSFIDPILSNQVFLALGLAPGSPIHLTDLDNLTFLYLGYQNITNISGLECARNLFSLDLSGNHFDPSPLSWLRTLSYLTLNDCALQDASFVSGLTNLTYLYLNNNQLQSIPVMNGLVNLFALEVSYNGCVANLARLAVLANLNYLALHSDCLPDLEFVSGMSQLQSLDVGGDSQTDTNRNSISDLTPLSDKTNLIWLSLTWNQVTNVPIVAAFHDLYNLYLTSNHFSNLSFLTNMPNLVELSIGFSSVTNLSFLSSHTSLASLDVGHIATSNLIVLGNLTNLTTLRAGGNNAGSAGAISNLTKLHVLGFEKNGVNDVSSLSGMTNLDSLYLSDNNLQNIHPVIYLTGLSYADLRYNLLDTNTLSAAMADISTMQSYGTTVDFAPQKLTLGQPIILSAAARLGSNQFRFNIQSAPGSVLRVWTSTDLSSWTAGPFVTNASGTTAYTNTSSATRLFFRVRQQ